MREEDEIEYEYKELPYDLRIDVPADAGYTLSDDYENRYYAPKDAVRILEGISIKMKNAKLKGPRKFAKFDVVIFGMITPAVFGRISVNLMYWDSVATITYIKPGNDPVLVYPIPEDELVME